MSVFQALGIGVTGVSAQSSRIGTISQNIANINTIGYKRTFADFNTLIAGGAGAPALYSFSGAMARQHFDNSAQGLILRTDSPTDIAIDGRGFFPVSTTALASEGILYTRAGSFLPDANGDYVNGAGFFLQAWALDANGNLPASLQGGVELSTASASFVAVNPGSITINPVPTSAVSLFANLKASQLAYTGPPAYDATDSLANMASETISPHFSIDVEVFDVDGAAHALNVGFLKTAINSWAVEIYARPASDVTTGADGQVASGTLTFNGDGSLAAVSPALAQAVPISWLGGNSNSITFDWGTAGAIGTGDASGLSQFDGDFSATVPIHNGLQAGQLASVEITEDGFIIGNYDSGLVRRLYKIPLAVFVEADNLENRSGNVFAATTEAGAVVFYEPTQGAGALRSIALEQSNTDLQNELAGMIIAQRAYQANTKSITTSDNILEDLTRMLG